MKTTRLILLFAIVLLYHCSNQVSAQTSGNVTAGRWYRIAQNTSTYKRANARFILSDQISGGGHSTLEFIAGVSYGYESGISFTMLNHNYYGTPTFTKVRILENNTYDPLYLEVYVVRSGYVKFSLLDNVQNAGWSSVSWQTGSVPGGYAVHEYDVNNLFAVGDNDSRLIVKRGGNVGIGINNPQSILHLYYPTRPAFRLQNSLVTLIFGIANSTGDYDPIAKPGDVVCKQEGTRHGLIFNMNDNNNDGKSYIKFSDNYHHEIMGVYNDGIVRVNGSLFAKEVKVKTDVWSDYVFDEDYKAMSINELEEYIHKYRHLPDIPTENEVKKNGIDIAKINSLLLKKIEELTIYIIEEDKKISELEQQLDKLSQSKGQY